MGLCTAGSSVSCFLHYAIEAVSNARLLYFFLGAQIKQLVKVRGELLAPTVVFCPESQGFPLKVAKYVLDFPFKECFGA